MLRTDQVKYVQTYGSDGRVTFREYYRLGSDPTEKLNVLGDGEPANDPPATEVAALAQRLETLATCRGSGCLG